jgi:plastocyanin
VCFLLGALSALAQEVTVTGRIELNQKNEKAPLRDQSDSVAWLTPLSSTAFSTANDPPPNSSNTPQLQLVQKNKSFEPHVLVVPVGSAVRFPNRDPWFHNVFSLFDGKRFDLGLYEAGESRIVHFDRVGISYIFCNIHPQMSAVVIALQTPYYAKSDRNGRFTIPRVPPGQYKLQVWSEHALPEAMQSESRTVVVTEASHSLGEIRMQAGSANPPPHKNKYGRDYDRQVSPDPAYR